METSDSFRVMDVEFELRSDSVHIQVHSKDIRVFICLWDVTSHGQRPLEVPVARFFKIFFGNLL